MNNGNNFNNGNGFNSNGMGAQPNNFNNVGNSGSTGKFFNQEVQQNPMVNNQFNGGTVGAQQSMNPQPMQPMSPQPMMNQQPVQPMNPQPMQPMSPQPMMNQQPVQPMSPQPMQPMSPQPMMNQQPVQPMNPQPMQPNNMTENGNLSNPFNPMVGSVPNNPIAMNNNGVPNQNPNPPLPPELTIKPKLNVNIKRIALISIGVLVVLLVALFLIAHKNVTCTNEQEVMGIKISSSVTASYWFGNINKITTKMQVDLSDVDEDARKEYIEYYEDFEEDGTKVKVTKDKIILTKVIKPTDEDETDISVEEFKESYEEIGDFTCK